MSKRSRMTDVERAQGVLLGMIVVAMAAITALVALDIHKTEHQVAGGHEPSPQAECYAEPGHGELMELQSVTFCNN